MRRSSNGEKEPNTKTLERALYVPLNHEEDIVVPVLGRASFRLVEEGQPPVIERFRGWGRLFGGQIIDGDRQVSGLIVSGEVGLSQVKLHLLVPIEDDTFGVLSDMSPKDYGPNLHVSEDFLLEMLYAIQHPVVD